MPKSTKPLETSQTDAQRLGVRARRSRERPVWRAGFLASLVVHALVWVFFPAGEVLLVVAAGANQGDFAASRGISELLQLTSAPPEAAIPLVPDIVVVEFEPEVFTPVPVPDIDLTLPVIETPGFGSTFGVDAQDLGLAGLVDGLGLGAAGTAPIGTTGRTPPSPRGMIMPPANRDLRGREVEVWVFVDEAGRVVPDSTRLVPPTPDRGFNEQLQQDAAQWVFEPARENGQPVAAWFPYTIGL